MMCVDCGKDADGLIDGSCAECFADKQALLVVPEVVQVELCAHCGARHVGAHWYDVPEDEPELWTLEDCMREACGVHAEVEGPLVHVDLEEKDNKTFASSVTLDGHVQDVAIHAEGSGLLRRTRGVCDRCSRINGGYYAAIIQMRATERDMTPPELDAAHKIVASELDRQLGTGNRFSFLAKSGPMHGGFDYYIGDIDAARNVSRRLKQRMGATILESAKLVGRREGEDVYRVTFLCRLQPFSPGDVVIHEGTPHSVLQVLPKGLQTLELEHQRRGRIPNQHVKRLGGQELIEEAVVVTRGAEGVMVLDPETQRTETILVPEDEVVGETVTVVRIEERLYWVPSGTRSANNP